MRILKHKKTIDKTSWCDSRRICRDRFPSCLCSFFAQLEFSRANMVRNALRSACHAGCRAGIVLGTTKDDVQNATEETLRNVGLTQFDVTVTPAVITSSTREVTVHISASVKDNSWITPFYTGSLVLENTMTMERELIDQVIF